MAAESGVSIKVEPELTPGAQIFGQAFFLPQGGTVELRADRTTLFPVLKRTGSSESPAQQRHRFQIADCT
jgi:hypothetical protein